MASSTSDRRPYRLVVNKEWENVELGGDEWEGGGDSEAVDKEQGRTKKFTARKRIESKKELNDAVREVSIATGRPLRYSVDDKLRVQVMCAQGCPFKMWVSFMEEFEGWQIKTVNDEHNCIYHFNNKLVTVKYLAEVYGDKIRRNPNWKLIEMQEEKG
ncbi:hypothetical protein POM88_026522 [Heracleum sosnowskyi]|uniref:Uncharacterized protein n=1 Tax=Heracleum sosnowskyi TaxID=360622 RepID=A0AAD8I6Q3_9APIA|nr:hypothetical protein POM88_026522 [Heracleum sosnowskyi]